MFSKIHFRYGICALVFSLSCVGINKPTDPATSIAAPNPHSKAPDSAQGKLFIVDVFIPTFWDGFIRRLNVDGTGLESLVNTGDGARGIAVDPDAGKIYWSDTNSKVIRRSNLDGTNQEDIVTTDLVFPFDVDIDVKRGKIYWGDQSLGQIMCANLDGTVPTILIYTPFGQGIAIDSVNKKLYWTTSITASSGDILRSDLDGSNIETVVTGVGKPVDIQIDPIKKKIYWTDFVQDVVRRSNFDGTSIEDLFVVGKNNNPNSLALDLKKGYVYWDQDGDIPNRSSIKRMRLNGENPENLIDGLGNVADMEFVPKLSRRRM